MKIMKEQQDLLRQHELHLQNARMYLPKIKIQERYRRHKDKRNWFLNRSVMVSGPINEQPKETELTMQHAKGEASQSIGQLSTDKVQAFEQGAPTGQSLASIEEVSVLRCNQSDEQSPRRQQSIEHTQSMNITTIQLGNTVQTGVKEAPSCWLLQPQNRQRSLLNQTLEVSNPNRRLAHQIDFKLSALQLGPQRTKHRLKLAKQGPLGNFKNQFEPEQS